MKCPECDYFFSDLRDICPKCRLDLRQFKLERGLPVTQPDAAYDDLVSKHSLKSEDKDQTGSFLSRLTGLVAQLSKSEQPDSSRIETSADVHPDREEQLSGVEDQFEALPEEQLPVESALELEIERESEPEAKAESEVAGIPVVEESFTHVQDASVDPSPPATLPRSAPAVSIEDLEIATMFQDCFDELRGFEESGFSIDFNQIENLLGREDIKLLFQMAMESIDSPDIEKLYQQEVVTPSKDRIKDSALQRVLERTERALDAPVFSLRSRKRKKKKKEISESPVASLPAIELKAAGMIRRLLGFSIDLLLFALVSVSLSVLCLQLLHPDLSGNLFLNADSSNYVLILFLGYLLLVSVFLSFAYNLISAIVFGQTPGALAVGVEYCNPERAEPSSLWSHIVLSSVYPFSILMFGYLPLFLGRRSLHERLAGVMLVRELPQATS